MNIAQILRTAEVERFHILRLTHRQTVGQHVYCVAHLALQLLQGLPDDTRLHLKQAYGWDHREMSYAALFHDIEESLTGDVPSPTKRAAMMLGFDWNSTIEQLVPGLPSAGNGTMASVLKMADLIDAWRYVYTYRCNPHGAHVAGRLAGVVSAYAATMNAMPAWVKLSVNWQAESRKLCNAIFQPVQELTDAPLLRE